MSVAKDIQLREAVAADLEGVLAIYNHYVITSHVTFDVRPITLAERRAWFATFGPDGPYRLWVATDGGAIQGYACSTPLRPKPAYDVSVETTLYVARDVCGRGLGRRLYQALLGSLTGIGLHRAFAAIALPNAPSVALHERCGFRRCGCFSEAGYKFDRYWDVAWYQRSLVTD